METIGHKAVPPVVSWAYGVTYSLPYIVIAIGSVVVPVLARRNLWARFCAGMANKPMHATCEDLRA